MLGPYMLLASTLQGSDKAPSASSVLALCLASNNTSYALDNKPC